MRATDTFVSTSALTIPVLMLAGTVELRGLTNLVRTGYLRNFRKEFLEYLESNLRPAPETPRLRPEAIRAALKKADRKTAFPIAVYGIPSFWAASLVIAGITEVQCLLFLGGSFTSNSLPRACVGSIIVLLVLLILTAMVQVFVVSTRAAVSDLVDLGNKTIEDIFSQISDHKVLTREELTERVLKLAESSTGGLPASESESRNLRYWEAGHPSRRWPPRRK
jgi:hypothetical protein